MKNISVSIKIRFFNTSGKIETFHCDKMETVDGEDKFNCFTEGKIEKVISFSDVIWIGIHTEFN